METQKFHEDISSIIQQMFEQKFLTADGVDSIKKLKDSAAAADEEIKRLNEQAIKREQAHHEMLTELTAERDQYRELSRKHAEIIQGWNAREKELLERERRINETEKAAAVAEAEARALRFSMSTVFAPNTIRSSVHNNAGRNYPGPLNNGYQQQVSENSWDNHNEQTTEGYETPEKATVPTTNHIGHNSRL